MLGQMGRVGGGRSGECNGRASESRDECGIWLEDQVTLGRFLSKKIVWGRTVDISSNFRASFGGRIFPGGS